MRCPRHTAKRAARVPDPKSHAFHHVTLLGSWHTCVYYVHMCVHVCVRTEEVGRDVQTELMAKSTAGFLGDVESWAQLTLPPPSGLESEPGLWGFFRKKQ